MAYSKGITGNPDSVLLATIALSIALHVAGAAWLRPFQFDTKQAPEQLQVELQPPKPEPPPPPPPEPEPPKPEPVKPQPKKIIPPPEKAPLPPPEKVMEAPQPVAPPPPPPQVIAAAPAEEAKPAFVAPAPEPEKPREPQPVVDIDADLGQYGNQLAREFAKHKQYPRIAQMRGWQGTVRVKIEVAADGSISSSTVTESSGYESLDKQALEMVKKAAPLPTPPHSLRGKPFSVTVPVQFRLQP